MSTTTWTPPDRAKHRMPVIFQVWLDAYSEPQNLPKIMMDPNPSGLTINSKVVEHRTQMYTGFYEETWGEGPGTISGDGTTKGFFLPGVGYVGDDDLYKTDAYRWYALLVEVFKNNGAVYDTDGNVFHQGGIYLMYDKYCYSGRFVDLRTEWEDPFFYKVSFSFEYGMRYLIR